MYRVDGVAIVFQHDFDGNIISVKEIVKGRALEANIQIDESEMTIINVYAPTKCKERSMFVTRLYDKILRPVLYSYNVLTGSPSD
jgi:hypothetical protein